MSKVGAILLCMCCLLLPYLGRSQSDLGSIDFAIEVNSIPEIDELWQKGKIQLQSNQGDSAIYTLFQATANSFHLKDDTLFLQSFNKFVKLVANWSNNIDSTRATLLVKALKWSNHFAIKNQYTQFLELLLGDYFSEINEQEKALYYFTKVINFSNPSQSPAINLTKAKAVNSISVIWIRNKEPQQARKSAKQLEDLRTQTSDVHIAIYENLVKAAIQTLIGQSDSCVFFYKKALELSTDGHYGCSCSDLIKAHLCEGYIVKGQPLRAMDTLQSLMQHYLLRQQKYKDKGFFRVVRSNELLRIKFLIAFAHAANNDLKLAEKGLLELLAQNSSERPMLLGFQLYIFRILVAIYTDWGRYKEANEFYSKLIKVYENSQIQQEKSKSVAFMYRLEQEKATSQQQLLIERQKSQLNRNRILLISGGIAAGLLVILAGGWYKAIKNKQRLHNSELQNLHKEKQLQALQSKMEGEEQARTQIARELHDGVSSRLLIAKLGLSTLNKSTSLQKSDQGLVTDVLEQLDVVTQQLRSTTHNLTPDLILRQGLIFAVAAYLDKIKQGKFLAVDFQTFGRPPALPEAVTIQLFRIIQESIQNTIKHAQATKLLVQLNTAADLFSITIEDNGVGFKISDAHTHGLGIQNMTKRMKELGGNIQLETQPGKGCTIYLEIDLQPKHLV